MSAPVSGQGVIAEQLSWFERTSRSALRTRESSARPHPRPGCVHVGRDAPPSSWKRVLLAPFELLALAWCVPIAVLAVAVPIAFLVALVTRVGAYWLRQL